jgi:hypothetical protein
MAYFEGSTALAVDITLKNMLMIGKTISIN